VLTEEQAVLAEYLAEEVLAEEEVGGVGGAGAKGEVRIWAY